MSELEPLAGALGALRQRMVAKGMMADVAGTEADLSIRQSMGMTQCDVCGGSGFVRHEVEVGHPDFGRAQRCQACFSQTMERRLARLPKTFRNWTLESFELAAMGHAKDLEYRALLASLRQWLAVEEADENWLYLFSAKSGRGKTGLAVALLRVLMERGAEGLFKIVPDVLDDIRSSFGSHEAFRDAGEPQLQGMKTADVLVLDDIGAHRPTAWVVDDVLFPLIASRHSEARRTILTSNYRLTELFKPPGEEMPHPRIVSRIRERCGHGNWVISLDGFPNLREL